MSEWMVLQFFSLGGGENTKLSAPSLYPGAMREVKTWVWFGAVGLAGFGTWGVLMRLALIANAMHRRSVATVVLFVTLAIGIFVAWLVADALRPMSPFL